MIEKRTPKEMQSYQEGFRAGVKMCIKAIKDNHAKYQEMMKPILELYESEAEE